MLETLKIAAGEQRTEVAKALTTEGQFKPVMFPLVQLLDPTLAGEMLAAKLSDPQTDAKSMQDLIDTASRMPKRSASIHEEERAKAISIALISIPQL